MPAAYPVSFFKEVNQVTAAAVHQEAKQPLENLNTGCPLALLRIEPNRRSKTGEMAILLRYLTKRLSPLLEVKVSEVASTLSITLPHSFLSAIVVFVIISHQMGLKRPKSGKLFAILL